MAKSILIDDMNKMSMHSVALSQPATLEEPEDPAIAKFTVTKPIKSGGHIRYLVTGEDADGPFEETRRFKEFYALRAVLATKWPGCYIPAIPEKKTFGNNDEGFVEERRSLLERFMKEVARFEYITHSKEFRTFSREKGDIEKLLNSLPR